jgi:hypothetical protein
MAGRAARTARSLGSSRIAHCRVGRQRGEHGEPPGGERRLPDGSTLKPAPSSAGALLQTDPYERTRLGCSLARLAEAIDQDIAAAPNFLSRALLRLRR